jgi:hypothetical protein
MGIFDGMFTTEAGDGIKKIKEKFDLGMRKDILPEKPCVF